MNEPKIILISCLDMDGNIGDKLSNSLLYNLKPDMENFKKTTTGNIVVMGRKTFESLPNGKLKDRENIVLTRNKDYRTGDDEVLLLNSQNIRTAVDTLKGYAKAREKDIYIIGGGAIYKKFLPFADEMLLTHVHEIYPDVHLIDPVQFPEYAYREWTVESVKTYEQRKIRGQVRPSFAIAKYVRKK